MSMYMQLYSSTATALPPDPLIPQSGEGLDVAWTGKQVHLATATLSHDCNIGSDEWMKVPLVCGQRHDIV